jgi:AraC-like DNA-binding protein
MSAVAAESGWYDEPAMCRAFRREGLCTPGAMRRWFGSH